MVRIAELGGDTDVTADLVPMLRRLDDNITEARRAL
jgi:hypothetical protein